MKLIKIRQDQFDTCEHLDQLGFLERAHFPGYTVYACAEETEGEENRFLGMIMFFVRQRTLVVEWLYVKPEHRGEGCADLLLSPVFELQEAGQIDRIAAYLPKVYGRSLICPWEESFLSDYFGETEVLLPGEWGSALMALEQHPKCMLPEKEDGIIYTPFTGLSADKTKETLSSFSGRKGEFMLYPVHELTRDLDENTSFAAYEKTDSTEVLCGGLLTQKAGGTLYVVLFFGNSRKICIGLWTRFVKAALQHYPGRMRVTMILRSENSDQRFTSLLDDLFQVNRKGYGRHTDSSLRSE